ncbi:MAG: hypothetical protein CMJ24_02560 [Phycisphaerae bacterium]|jgi:hypothetical protein|nr:hypothetical protein [Phycisphaerae bacterium]|tara:strand:- start:6062 stop:6388 length:327 start_codon:yes stop_codon:yes gene_type:complete
MIHDQSFSRILDSDVSAGERRSGCRDECTGELVIDWHMMPGRPGRYGIVNESCNGCLIRSALPLLEGMTGRIRTRLPEGSGGKVSVVVAWSRRVEGRYHVGLRFFAAC